LDYNRLIIVEENCPQGGEGSIRRRQVPKKESVELLSDGGCGVAVTARKRIGWMKFRECGELLNGKMFCLKVKGKASV